MVFPRSRQSSSEAVRQRLARILDPDLSSPPATRPATEATLKSQEATQPTTFTELVPAGSADLVAARRGMGSPGTSTVPGQLSRAFGVDGARVHPGRHGLRSLAAVAVAVLVLAGGLAWWSRPRPEPIPTPQPAAAPVAHPRASSEQVVVAVTGKVRRPGLVTLASGSRVADAITAAGGVLPGTEIGYLNLARKVTDGELIVVGATPPPEAQPGAGPEGLGAAGGKVNLNTASLQQLDGLPGVGPVLAQRILNFRDQHGSFRSVTDLRQVDGIGPARYEQLKDLVTV
ncbi:MAG TPA: ComEA family DNA-binding protein [Micromonosporaceae bacterium]|nr:ComEA family DNA-binding protein [Micromonosporaceae bacterium]